MARCCPEPRLHELLDDEQRGEHGEGAEASKQQLHQEQGLPCTPAGKAVDEAAACLVAILRSDESSRGRSWDSMRSGAEPEAEGGGCV